jgi:hypothetical protein
MNKYVCMYVCVYIYIYIYTYKGKVLTYATTALMRGESVIIDRCNFDRKQRQHWTKLADEIQFKQVIQFDELYF